MSIFDELYRKALNETKGGKVIPFPVPKAARIKVKLITFDFAEGSETEKAPFLKKLYASWDQANKAVKDMAHYASPKGGYDKTDFHVVWRDGEKYDGRVDIEHKMIHSFRPLTEHILNFLNFACGNQKPAHLSIQQYTEYLQRLEKNTPGQTEAIIKFLTKYDFGDTEHVLQSTPPAGKTLRQQGIEKEEQAKAAEAKRLSAYPPAVTDRNEAIARIKEALKRRSGKVWSVTGGSGTAHGWIKIMSPPKRQVGYGYLSPEDAQELKTLLGLERMHQQGESIPASGAHRTEYVDRAEGRKPRRIGEQYWD